MKNRLATFNKLLARVGYSISHASDDYLANSIVERLESLRFEKVDDASWGRATSALAASAHLRTLLCRLEFDFVIDVGANKGQFASELRHLGYAGAILSFEPNPNAFRSIAEKAESDSNWTVVQGGVGAKSEELELLEYSDDSFSSFKTIAALGREEFEGMVDVVAKHLVKVRPLQDWIVEIGLQDFGRALLKTDTQGFDLNVLRGAESLLPSVRAIQTEMSYQAIYEESEDGSELLSYILGRGYVPTGMFPISHRAKDLSLIEADCFFVKKAV